MVAPPDLVSVANVKLSCEDPKAPPPAPMRHNTYQPSERQRLGMEKHYMSQRDNLNQGILKHRAEIRTDGYPISIGELLAMYKDSELDIHPEFQRFFRWSPEQKSRLIESLLLGIPLPSIFVSQRENGIFDVIDGLQRLSTIFQL